MRFAATLLLRLVCSLALVFSALPSRAGVVCVAGGRTVATCAMASLPGRGAETRMACCRPATTKAAFCPAHKGARCVVLYRSGLPSIAGTKAIRAKAHLFALVALPRAFVPVGRDVSEGSRETTPAPDSDPPRRRPRVPDRGRAPPGAWDRPLSSPPRAMEKTQR